MESCEHPFWLDLVSELPQEIQNQGLSQHVRAFAPQSPSRVYDTGYLEPTFDNVRLLKSMRCTIWLINSMDLWDQKANEEEVACQKECKDQKWWRRSHHLCRGSLGTRRIASALGKGTHPRLVSCFGNGCPTFGLKPNQNVERKTKNAVPLALLPLPPDIQSNILSASVAFGTAGVPLNVC